MAWGMSGTRHIFPRGRRTIQISRSIPCTPHAPSEARHVIDELAPLLSEIVMDDLRLVVSELVTNAVVHSSPDPQARVDLRVDVAADRVRLEVLDEGESFVQGGRHPAATDG